MFRVKESPTEAASSSPSPKLNSAVSGQWVRWNHWPSSMTVLSPQPYDHNSAYFLSRISGLSGSLPLYPWVWVRIWDPKPRVTNIKGTNLKSLSLRLTPQDLCISVSGFTIQRWEVIVSRLGNGKIENQ